MLLEQAILDALVLGRVDLAFRRWDAPRVKVGTRMRTSHGLVEVLAVDEIAQDDITADEAARAGEASLGALLARLGEREGRLFRIRLRHAGEDPRVALRAEAHLSDRELAEVRARLDRLDASSRHGAWTRDVLRLLADRPGVRAALLAKALGREVLPFKRDVRKLKELGLTEGLETGYRLSPRGRVVLDTLRAAP
jgi:hypothetical protein